MSFINTSLSGKALDAKTSRRVRLRNYERIFDAARGKVRKLEECSCAKCQFKLSIQESISEGTR
jgi:hypothetical protein